MTLSRVTKTFIQFSFCLLVLIPPINGQSKQKTPLEGLQSIPFPPKTIQEAFHRCPADRDTLVDSAALEIDRYIGELKHLSNASPSTWTRKQLQAKKELNKKILKDNNAVPALLADVADSSAKKLLDEVRIIGEELDSQIKNCPPAKAGFDTACVAGAERVALMKRREASIIFIRHVHSSWSGLIDSLKTILATRTALAQEVSGAESQKQNHELWSIVRKVLETEQQISKLAVKFSR